MSCEARLSRLGGVEQVHWGLKVAGLQPLEHQAHEVGRILYFIIIKPETNSDFNMTSFIMIPSSYTMMFRAIFSLLSNLSIAFKATHVTDIPCTPGLTPFLLAVTSLTPLTFAVHPPLGHEDTWRTTFTGTEAENRFAADEAAQFQCYCTVRL